MKSLKSSLLHKLIIGYRIAKIKEGAKFEPFFTTQPRAGVKEHGIGEFPSSRFVKSAVSTKPSLKPMNIEDLSETYKLPVSMIKKIYSEAKEIESNLSTAPMKGFDFSNFKNKIEDIEKTAIDSGAYLAPEIKNLISNTKGRLNELELGVSPETDPLSEVRKQIEESEREKRNLEEAKRVIMEKYYNREIDESSIKNIMDNYEQRLVETNIKIKNLHEEFEEMEKEPKKYPKRSSIKQPEGYEGKLTTPSTTPSREIAAPAPNFIFKLSRMLPAPKTQTQTIEAGAALELPEQKVPKFTIETKDISPKFQGFEIPQIPKSIKIGSIETEETPPLSLTYPLIPRVPERGQQIFSYAKIFWEENNNRYMYDLIEPRLTEKLKDVYKKVKEMLEQKLDIDFSKLKKIEARDFLDNQIDDVLTYYNFILTDDEKKILKYYMARDFIGLETIEPLMQDPNIEDISCDGVRIPLFVFHRNPDIGSIMTNRMFNSEEQLDSFIIRLAQLCGKSISVSQPLLDGTLPDGSRIQATLGTDIARRGSNFTIRKFTEEPLTPVHLINYGTLDSTILAYLWFVIDYGRSLLVSGGTASGKTSLLNVLSLFIRPEKKIVSIEDTAELRLPHSHWIPVVSRIAIGEEGKGEVDMFELLRESLRQRPDYIVVGEVRGKEAYILFQQMATGHPSLATIHAENMARLINRLITPPISLPVGLINSLDIVVFLARMKYKNKFIRKVVEIVEIVDFDEEKNKPIINQVYKWNPQNDKFEVINKSISLKRISDFTGINEKDIRSEIERRIVILEWMRKNNILDYRDVHRIFSIYYNDPERLLSAIEGAS